MSRAPKSFRSARLLSLLTVAALCLVPALAARAASYVYGSRQRTVNAGVLITGTASAPLTTPTAPSLPAAPDPSPYVFYLFNLRTDVKPFGWNVVNPQAPSVVGAGTALRWTAYSVGQSVTPDMAAYWEVPLSDTSSAQLQQYDVLYLPLGGTLAPADNEKLRRFVDGGGQLWIESDPHTATPIPNPGTLGGFASFFNVKVTAASGTTNGPALPASGAAFLRHPILSQPFLMSYDDLFGLGESPGATVSDASNLFGDALLSGSATSVSVSQYGAGQIVACALDVGGAINDYAGDVNNTSSGAFRYNNGPFCGAPGTSHALNTTGGFINMAAAPTASLRFLSNLISLAGTHPNENKTGRQNASSNDLASFAPAWSYPVTPPATVDPPPGAAVWGNWVYVTTYSGTTGTLHAFDAYPAEFLTAIGQPDDGIADFGASPPMAYDEVWNADVKANASAPTVASSGGSTSVYVEEADGSVHSFDAVTGKAGGVLAPPAPSVSGAPTTYPAKDSSSNTLVANAPAPVVYNGQIYAGQPNSDLLVGPVVGGTGSRVPVVPAAATVTPEAVCASPSVGVLADGDLTNDLVAVVPSTQNLYTVFLGARADLLQSIPNTTSPAGYNVNRGRLRLYNLQIQYTANAKAYTYVGASAGSAAGPYPNTPDFSGSQTGAVYGDYDANLDPTASPSSFQNGQTLNLNQISDFSYGAVSGGALPAGAVVSAPATDRNGDLYYTVNAGHSYLFGVHEDPQFQNVRIKFRFRLPEAGETFTDADGVVYDAKSPNSLVGYSFVGAPVVDSQGLIYVAAANGTNAAILCFSATQPIYADAGGAFDPSQATYTQADEFNGSQPNQLRPGPVDGTLRYGQFSAVGSRVTFYNFGIGTGQVRQIAGNLTEPQPVQATPNADPNQAQQNLGAQTLPLHTNLVWYGTFSLANAALAPHVSGVTEVANALYLTDGLSLYQFSTIPTLTGKMAALAPTTISLGLTPPAASLPNVTPATPSAGTGVLVVNSLLGVGAFTQQLTLVTDNNRILEVDAMGNAVWGVDATASAAQGGKTYVDFSHPTSLSQVTANDYLVADTGNNRCVRFDRAGDVIWELTHFNDPNGLLAAGQPLSLNAPTSVQMLRSQNGTQTEIHYLIADSGNFRVLEVTDTVDPNTGKITGDHVLTWASHTGDKFGRRYRYGSATYFNVNSSGVPASVVAAISNARLAPIGPPNTAGTANALGPAGGDAPGGSLIGFSYALGTSSFATVPMATVTGIYTSFQVQGASANTTYQIRDPRYLSVYTPPTPPTNGPPFSLLYADDNGAFDLTPTATGFTVVGTTDANSVFHPGLHFTQADYEDMSSATTGTTNFIRPLPADAGGDVPLRAKNLSASPPVPGIPFVPSCVQRIGTNQVQVGVDTSGKPIYLTLPRYLITQNNGQSELGGPNAGARIGGEIFEVGFDPSTATNNYRGASGFGGSTLSRPGLTGPLTQPTSAIRPQQ